MSEMVAALDTYVAMEVGENGHGQLPWSNMFHEQVVQLSFQLTRCDEAKLNELAERLRSLLSELKNLVYTSKDLMAVQYLRTMYTMIGYTRDVIDGKGEYSLTYMMIYEWYNVSPELAKYAAAKLFRAEGDEMGHPFGSCKDIKYLCDYVRKVDVAFKGTMEQASRLYNAEKYTEYLSLVKEGMHPLVHFLIELTTQELRKEVESPREKASLLAKWIPREKSKYGWLFKLLAMAYFPEYIASTEGKTDFVKYKAIHKCMTQYRRLIADMNRSLDTLQVKQCGKRWAEIDFDKGVTSISMTRQTKAFLNVKGDKERHPGNEDRIACRSNFVEFLAKAKKGEVQVKGKRVGMEEFTKRALTLGGTTTESSEKELLDAQWVDSASQTSSLGKMIAMVDVSGSMHGDPMNAAIALGLRIAEKSILGQRVMTFSQTPTWVNLEGIPSFVDRVTKVSKAPWGINTNFAKALDMILEAIVLSKLTAEQASDMVLVILSDMQIDAADEGSRETLYVMMERKYAEAGKKLTGSPYTPPHILFWNLRSTGGFPNLSSEPNTSMMSGFSPAVLSTFCDVGVGGLQSFTPWSMLMKALENKRYHCLREYFDKVVTF